MEVDAAADESERPLLLSPPAPAFDKALHAASPTVDAFFTSLLARARDLCADAPAAVGGGDDVSQSLTQVGLAPSPVSTSFVDLVALAQRLIREGLVT